MALKSQRISTAEFTAALAAAQRLNAESKTPNEVVTEVGEHPEGHKRGGYVPVYATEHRVYWDENACEWFAYDDEDS